MRVFLRRFLPVLDVLLAPWVLPSGLLLRTVRRVGVHRLPLCKRLLLGLRVFPIRDHYYEPQFDVRRTKRPLSAERPLPAVDWNVAAQLQLLDAFRFAGELTGLQREKPASLGFYLDNIAFEAGDAEYWYQLIRLKKPRRIFEVGSGHSTLMAREALRKNQAEDPSYRCRHVCIEPYEMPWLERVGIEVVRKRVEELEVSFFSELEENDILFIDSSHVIRPEGDVLFEYLELLPTLRKGVIVHAHDIFSPRNYLKRWLIDEVKFWNEQYLLEAFLSHNPSWRIIGAVNYLHHNHPDRLRAVAPFLTPDQEPCSFYLQKVT